MAIDITKLNKMKKELDDKTSGNLVYASKIKEQMDIRILPPHPEMDGIPYFERICWSVGDKTFTSAETFGLPCVIEEEVSMATALVEKFKSSKLKEEKAAAAELAKLLNSWKSCKKKSEYLIPILVVHDGEDEITVSAPKIFSCGVSVVQKLTEIFTNKKYMNGTMDGVADRVKGRNFTITKKGVDKETEYGATPWPNEMEMPEQYYKDAVIPNPVDFVRKGLKGDEYLRSVIRNYLYGDPIIEDETRTDEEEKPKVKAVNLGAKANASPAGASRRAVNLGSKKVVLEPAPEPEEVETTEEISPEDLSGVEETKEGMQPDKSFDQPAGSVGSIIRKTPSAGNSSTGGFPKAGSGAVAGKVPVKGRSILGDMSKK
mgnify:CR=1 FL=1